MSVAPPTLPAETMIGRYRVVQRLGAGGMGEVYEAVHVDLNKRVAVKILLPSIASRPEIIARFLREGQATAKLRHPHAVDISDVGVDHGVPFLVMEYLDGETLEALIAREAPIAPSRIAELLLPVFAAVKAAHEEGIVHRDLKPANIFLHRSRDHKLTPKVLDFGISKMADDDGVSALTQTASLLGTPHYMSPEQLRSSKHVDARSDQYALGTILYECSTRTKPFRGETPYVVMNAIANGAFAPPSTVVPALPLAFEEMVLRAMNNSPEARFESVHALGCALITFADARTRAFWESVFDDEPTTALPSWSAAPSADVRPSETPSHRSLAGAMNSVTATPAPGLRGSIPGVTPGATATPAPAIATPLAATAQSPETLVGSVVPAPATPPKRSLVAVVALAAVLVLAVIAGAAFVTARSATPATSPAPTPPTQASPQPVTPPVATPPAAPVAAAPPPPPTQPTIAAPTAAATPTQPAVQTADDVEEQPTRHGRRHRRRARSTGTTSSASGTNDIPILR